MNEMLRRVFKRLHYPIEVILVWVRWYMAYPLSLRHLEEMVAERGVAVDHSTIRRWAIKMLPLLAVTRRYLPSTQAASGHELAHGRNVHQGCRPVEVSLPGC